MTDIKQITSTPEEFKKALNKATEIVNSWPEWKKKTKATSYPRPKCNVKGWRASDED